LYDIQGLQGLFKGGRIGIVSTDTALGDVLTDKDPGFEWEETSIPPGPEGDTVAGDFGYYSISAKSENRDAAWEYIKFLTNAENSANYIEEINKIIAQTLRSDSAEILYPPEERTADNVGWHLQNDLIPRVQVWTPHPNQLRALKAVSDEFELMCRGEKSAAQTVKDANAAVTEVAQA
jgi:ABC-type glycerol-3-phosphate transport system substrate-binding protein